MLELVAGLVLFFAAHSFTMWRDRRQSAIDRLGPLGYRAVYSLVSLLGLVLIVHGFDQAPRLVLWTPPPWTRHVTMLLMLPVFVLLLAAYMPGHIKAKVKNPMLMALKTWALAHLVANGDLASVLLFGAFLAWGVADLIAVKRGARSPVVARPRALFDAIALVAGLTIYGAFLMRLHQALIGVPLLMH